VSDSTTPAFRGNNPKSTAALLDWHALTRREQALEPWIPIVDAHHHLYGQLGDERYYRMRDLVEDLQTGHRIIGTVYVEGYQAGWRETGPVALRPVGEVDRIVALTPSAQTLPHGPCQVAAGVVAHADLRLGDAVAEVLDAHLAAGQGRLRGIRHITAWDGGTVGSQIVHLPARHLMADAGFRRGLAQLQRRGLSWDVWVYHHQLGELRALVDAFPDLTIVVDHVAGLIGVAECRRQHAALYAQWVQDLRALAARPNVWIKMGGLGMALFGFGFEHEARPGTSRELALAWQPLVDACIETFGPQRCMFETNFPVDKQSGGYVETWNAYKRLTTPLSVDERRDLFYRSACRAYRLPQLQQIGDACERPGPAP
jgi:L-fuconolactonase